jgi:hypothetical protein
MPETFTGGGRIARPVEPPIAVQELGIGAGLAIARQRRLLVSIDHQRGVPAFLVAPYDTRGLPVITHIVPSEPRSCSADHGFPPLFWHCRPPA